jgi:hypothetical protein
LRYSAVHWPSRQRELVIEHRTKLKGRRNGDHRAKPGNALQTQGTHQHGWDPELAMMRRLVRLVDEIGLDCVRQVSNLCGFKLSAGQVDLGSTSKPLATRIFGGRFHLADANWVKFPRPTTVLQRSRTPMAPKEKWQPGRGDDQRDRHRIRCEGRALEFGQARSF